MQNCIADITTVVVCSNTRFLIERAFNSIRHFHPQMPFVIIDGSTPTDECYDFVCSLSSDIVTVGVFGFNIGHGKGMNTGINMVKTKFALVCDSDVEMLKSPLDLMLEFMEEDTYGVGAFDYVDERGFGKNNHSQQWRDAATKYLHPYFQLINVNNYRKFSSYVHHGSPCYKAMNDIKKQGLSDKILKEFPGASIYGSEYIRHDTDGTRGDRRRKGKKEIEGGWDKNGNSSTGSRGFFKGV